MNSKISILISFTILLVLPLTLFSQTEITVGEVRSGELDYKEFTLNRDSEITITGSGVLYDGWDNNQGFYGWILDSETRQVVWHLLKSSKQKRQLRRERIFDFEEKVSLEKGNYEVYYTGIYGGNGNINDLGDLLGEIFNSRKDELDRRDRKRLKMTISAPKSVMDINDRHEHFNRLIDKAVVSITGVGDDENVKDEFSLKDNTRVRIYVHAEGRNSNISDNAWIYDVRKNRKVWDINRDNATHAGGGDKNILVVEVIELPKGSYQVRYISDDSHSFDKWNVFPPNDPQFWGITIWVDSEKDLGNVIAFKEVDIIKPIIELTHIRDDELVSQGISLDKSMDLQILCIGEGTREMVDYGWIIDADSRDIVWKMKWRKTKHAGGGEKNRIIDEIVSFKKGKYIVSYQTDDSHSFRDWNTTPPYDQEKWGITVWTDDEDDMDNVDFFEERDFRSDNILAEIVKVQDNEYLHESFEMKRNGRIRIIAIGEGRRGEMYDYGWIINDKTDKTVWKMRYSRTDPAGGSEKNRIFNDTISLERGKYTVYFETDDSHSYRDWNTASPRDEEKYGITIIKQ